MLVWIENAPKFAENDEEEVIEYIDKVTSCSSQFLVTIRNMSNIRSINTQGHAEKVENRFVDSAYHSRLCGKPQSFVRMMEMNVKFTKKTMSKSSKI